MRIISSHCCVCNFEKQKVVTSWARSLLFCSGPLYGNYTKTFVSSPRHWALFVRGTSHVTRGRICRSHVTPQKPAALAQPRDRTPPASSSQLKHLCRGFSTITEHIMSSLDNLGIVANVMGVADCSTKVIALLIQYSRDISNARKDKAALVKEATALHYLFGQLKAILSTTDSAQLKVSRSFPGIMAACETILNELYMKLSTPDESQSRGERVLAALTWPLKSKDVKEYLVKLKECQRLTEKALQFDHLYVSEYLCLVTFLGLCKH